MKKILGLLIFLAAAGGGTYYSFKYGKPVEKPQVVQAKVSRDQARTWSDASRT